MIVTDDFIEKPFKLLIGSDHGGWEIKEMLLKYLRKKGINIQDVGPLKLDPVDDYPDYAAKLASKISRGEADSGILICRSGIGMSINANRFRYVRAALSITPSAAALSRSHNNSNILVTGGNSLSDQDIISIVETWLDTPFSNDERHARRIQKIEINSREDMAAIQISDPQIGACIANETTRQDQILELIASENIVSPAIRAAQGSCLTNKYAEGYPGRRYYDGCENVDEVENLAINRALQLFGAECANVQPHSGSQANMAAYFSILEPGDVVLAMDLAHGGHLTHGLKVNFSGRYYRFVGYGVDCDSERIDYDKVSDLADQHKPKMILAGASAYSRKFDFKKLREIADSVNAYFVVDMAHIAGLVAAGVHSNPVEFADIVTSTTHKTLRGPRGGLILCKEKFHKKINSQIFPGIQGGPLMHVIAAKAICFKEALGNDFKSYQKQVIKNAQHLAKELTQFGFRVVSGGTDNHLMLVDLRPLQTTGNLAAKALDNAGITVNKNLIPYDPEKPTKTSGIRIGTPSVTTRGMKEIEMTQIAKWIYRVVSGIDDMSIQEDVKSEIIQLTRKFPILPALVN